MANNIFWGKIYEYTNWGKGVVNNISWGKIYANLAGSIPSFALDFANIATDFTFTRSSFATRVNEQGLIETVTDLGSELVQNGDFEELGSELVVNGDFATDSNWNLAVGHTIENGVFKINSTGYKITTQPKTLTIDKTYKVTFDVLNYVSGRVSVGLAGSNADNTTSDATSNGSYEFYVTRTSGGTNNISIITSISSELEIDNVSVKQVDPNDDWSFSNASGTKGWRIADGRAICDETGSANGRNLQQFLGTTITSGKRYKVSLDILQSEDNIALIIGGENISLPTGTNLGYETTFTASSTSTLITFFSGTSDTQEIDNVSVQEVLEDDVPRIDYTNSTFENALGSELITNGAFDTDSDWVKGTGWSISGGKAFFDNPTGTELYQSLSTTASKYRISFDLDITSGTIQTSFTSPSTSTIESFTTSGTKTVDITTTASFSRFRFVGIGGSVFNIDNVSIKEVTGQIATDKGEFLLEPQSTNLLPYSEDFTQWTVAGTLTSNAGISPDGTQNADLLEASGIKGRLVNSATLLPATDYTVSMYVKASTTSGFTKFRIYEFDSASFTLSQIVTSQLIVGEWVRVTSSFTSNLGGLCQVRLLEDLPIGENAYVYGAQLEQLSYATSYIPTNGSAVTRSAELCVDATPTINSEEGTLYVEASALLTGQNRYVTISDGTTNNYLELLWFGTNDNLRVASKGTPAGFQTKTIPNIGQENSNKIAFKYSSDGISIYVNGSEVGVLVSDSSFAPSTLTTLGFSRAGVLPFYGRTKDLRVYTEALSDSELEELTTI